MLPTAAIFVLECCRNGITRTRREERMRHLRILKYVDEVARTGSIRKAAARLHVTASAVNRRIVDLELELGAQLLERKPRGVRLTAAGEEVWMDEIARAAPRDRDQRRSSG